MRKIQLLFVVAIGVQLLFGCESPETKPVISIEPGKIGVIGYGSLTSRQDVEKLLGRPYKDSLYYVHLENYQRAWNYVGSADSDLQDDGSKYNFIYVKNNDTLTIQKKRLLNIVPSDSTDLNGILYFITLDELDQFDDREIGFARIDVTDDIKEYDFKNGRVVAYKALPEFEYNADRDKDISIVEKKYWDLLLAAYDKVGEEYRKEFENSTQQIDTNLVVQILRVKIQDTIKKQE